MENIAPHVFHSALFDEEYRIDLSPPPELEDEKENELNDPDNPMIESPYSSSALEGVDALSLNAYSPYGNDLLSPYSFPPPQVFSSFPASEGGEFCLVESEIPSKFPEEKKKITKHKRQKSQVVDPEYSLLSASENIDENSQDQSKGDVHKKQKRLERNRTSARESRRRKKEFYDNLAGRSKRLEEEIEFYKAELARTQKQNIEFKEYFDAIRLTQDSKEKSGVPYALHHMWNNLGRVSSERERDIRFLFEQFLERMVPPIMKYFLYTATLQNGIYRQKSSLKSSAKVESKTQSLSREKFRRILDVSKDKYEQIKGAGAEIRKAGERIKEKVNIMWMSQRELVEEMKVLEKVLNDQIYTKIGAGGAINLGKIIEEDQVEVNKFTRNFLQVRQVESTKGIPFINSILSRPTLGGPRETRTRKRPKIFDQYES